MKTMTIAIQKEEYQQRIDKLLKEVLKRKGKGVVLFDRDYILYYTGFAFIPTERPIAFVANASGESALFVPYLEASHASQIPVIDKVSTYPEYPGKKHPIYLLVDLLQNMGINGGIAADMDGYPWIFGYRGETLSSIVGKPTIRIQDFVETSMRIKSTAELDLIKESVKWGHLAHVLLQRYTRAGLNETEVSLRASDQATRTMLDAIGPIYQAQSYFASGASAGYRGQIGRNAAIPHALANNIVFMDGDVLVTGANAPVWGYNSELERTMILGKPNDDQKRFFSHMLAIQNLAFDAIRPGRKCADVDRIVLHYYEEHQLMEYRYHHVGHSIGIRYHESPYFDIGDDTIIEPGMVFTVEPGLYIPEIGGFRHSDTIAVTDTGIELLTYYPRDLESLTIPV